MSYFTSFGLWDVVDKANSTSTIRLLDLIGITRVPWDGVLVPYADEQRTIRDSCEYTGASLPPYVQYGPPFASAANIRAAPHNTVLLGVQWELLRFPERYRKYGVSEGMAGNCPIVFVHHSCISFEQLQIGCVERSVRISASMPTNLIGFSTFLAVHGTTHKMAFKHGDIFDQKSDYSLQAFLTTYMQKKSSTYSRLAEVRSRRQYILNMHLPRFWWAIRWFELRLLRRWAAWNWWRHFSR